MELIQLILLDCLAGIGFCVCDIKDNKIFKIIFFGLFAGLTLYLGGQVL